MQLLLDIADTTSDKQTINRVEAHMVELAALAGRSCPKKHKGSAADVSSEREEGLVANFLAVDHDGKNGNGSIAGCQKGENQRRFNQRYQTRPLLR